MTMNQKRISEILSENAGCVTEKCQALRWMAERIKELESKENPKKDAAKPKWDFLT